MRAEVRRRILSRCNWTTEATKESCWVLVEEEEDAVEAGGDSGRGGGDREGSGYTVGGERGVDVERPTGVRGAR